MLPVMFGMLGLVEAGKVYGVKNQLQATADAAAMASVRQVLGDAALVRQKAVEYAELPAIVDPAAEDHGEVYEFQFSDGTPLFGTQPLPARIFSPSGVRSRRSAWVGVVGSCC